jgi:flagellar assembly protein FliH
MSARRANALVMPFQFPSLDEEAEPHDAFAFISSDEFSTEDAVSEIEDDFSAPDEEADATAEIALTGEVAPAEAVEAPDEERQRGFVEGREEGYAAGLAEGVEAGKAEAAREAERLAVLLGSLGVPLAALEQPIEDAVAALALEVARCVIGDEVKRSHKFLVRLVREAIGKVPLDMGAPRVVLNPADLDLIRRHVPEIEAGGATLVADDTVEVGGALVVADGEEQQIKDRRWNPRTRDGVSQVNLTLSSRWREVMLVLFDGEEE